MVFSLPFSSRDMGYPAGTPLPKSTNPFPAMTQELFREDAYRIETEAAIIAGDERGLRLDRTVFYPRGGGQAGDSGAVVLGGGLVAWVRLVEGSGGSITGELRVGLPNQPAQAKLVATSDTWLRPISVDATRMRAPVSVSSREAFEASFTSPPPVNPDPWKKSASPIPRRVPLQAFRLRRKSERRTASRRTRSALVSGPSLWPVAVVSPGRSAGRSFRTCAC